MNTYLLRFLLDPKDPRCDSLSRLCCEMDEIRDTLRASGVASHYAQSMKDNEFEVFLQFADWQKETVLYLCRAFCRERDLTLEVFLETTSISYQPM